MLEFFLKCQNVHDQFIQCCGFVCLMEGLEKSSKIESITALKMFVSLYQINTLNPEEYQNIFIIIKGY